MFKTIAIFTIFAIVAVMAAPNADPKADPKPKPGVLAYSSPVVASYVPSAAIVDSAYYGSGYVYPYASASYIASPYAYSAYTAPVYVR